MAVHQGGCHCGQVRFEAELELEGLLTCNCSICGKTGAIMAFIPREKLKVLSGEEQLTDYQFGKRRIHHLFCSVCGVRGYGEGPGPDGKPWAMVNVRCLDGVDVHVLPVERRHDGRAD